MKPDEGPWLIRSHYHNAWHCRGADGSASGYTSDIARAGVFEFEKARTYNDWGTNGGRDEAVPVSRAIADQEARLAQMTAERDAFASVVESIRASLLRPTPSKDKADG